MKRFRTIDEPAEKKQALPPNPAVNRTHRSMTSALASVSAARWLPFSLGCRVTG